MDLKSFDAANAYSAAARSSAGTGIARGDVVGTDKKVGDAFSSMVEEMAGDLAETTRAAEATSMKAIAGQADLVEVVSAVNTAEMTMQTVVSVRDKVLQAYNDIMKMPI